MVNEITLRDVLEIWGKCNRLEPYFGKDFCSFTGFHVSNGCRQTRFFRRYDDRLEALSGGVFQASDPEFFEKLRKLVNFED